MAKLAILDDLRIASPCDAKWEDMRGGDRVRVCRECAKNVYDLSAMTREEIGELVRATEGRFCASLWRRADGTVLTSDCPVGFDRVRRKTALALAAALSLFGLLLGFAMIVARLDREHSDAARGALTVRSHAERARTHEFTAAERVCNWVDPPGRASLGNATGRVVRAGEY